MNARQRTTDQRQQDERQYALRRDLGFWELIFEGRRAVFKHELGAMYVACLLLEPPREPIHAVALALKARDLNGQSAGPGEVVQQRSMGLEDAETVRALWRRQCTLERVLEDDEAIEPVKAEALRELEEVTEFLRKSPWRSRGGAERCVRAVTAAIKRLHVRLPGRWTPRASRIRCCRHLPATCTSTCWFLRAGAGDTPGDGLPRSTPGVSPTSRRGEWCGVRKAEV
jgi:hypothetical protein